MGRHPRVGEIMAGQPAVASVAERQPRIGYASGLEAGLLERARALLPLLRRNAPLGEAQRSPTDEVVAALDELGSWATITPRRWGGLGLPSITLHRINRELAKGDPAVAWVHQIINGCTWIASLTSDRLQEEIFSGSRPPRVCSSFAVACRADVVEGGYLVSGTWPYNSGSRQSSWGQYLVTAYHPDGTVKPGNFVYIPLKELEIGNDWQSAGIQGSSSDSTTAHKVFVPEHRFVPFERGFGYREPGKRHVGEPSDHWQLIPLIRAAGAGLIVGAVEAALEVAVETAKTRALAGTTYARQKDSAVVQRHLGELSAKVAVARDLAEGLCQILDEGALTERVFTPLERAQQKARVSVVVEMLAAAMDRIMFVAGSSAFSRTGVLERFWRDVNVATRHMIYIPDTGYEVLGRTVLGVEPNIIPPSAI